MYGRFKIPLFFTVICAMSIAFSCKTDKRKTGQATELASLQFTQAGDAKSFSKENSILEIWNDTGDKMLYQQYFFELDNFSLTVSTYQFRLLLADDDNAMVAKTVDPAKTKDCPHPILKLKKGVNKVNVKACAVEDTEPEPGEGEGQDTPASVAFEVEIIKKESPPDGSIHQCVAKSDAWESNDLGCLHRKSAKVFSAISNSPDPADRRKAKILYMKRNEVANYCKSLKASDTYMWGVPTLDDIRAIRGNEASKHLNFFGQTSGTSQQAKRVWYVASDSATAAAGYVDLDDASIGNQSESRPVVCVLRKKS